MGAKFTKALWESLEHFLEEIAQSGCDCERGEDGFITECWSCCARELLAKTRGES